MRVRLVGLPDPDLDPSGVDLSDMMAVSHGRQNVCGNRLLTSRTSSCLKSNFVNSSAWLANTNVDSCVFSAPLILPSFPPLRPGLAQLAWQCFLEGWRLCDREARR
jgi:hypothetical protein